MDFRSPILDNPELIGTGVVRSVGVTVNGTATHFERETGLRALCGAFVAAKTDSADWVSCSRCMAAARKAVAA